jgi:hypothetical protein
MNIDQTKHTFRHKNLRDTSQETLDILQFIDECIIENRPGDVFQMYAIINWFEHASIQEKDAVIKKMLSVHYLATLSLTKGTNGIS